MSGNMYQRKTSEDGELVEVVDGAGRNVPAPVKSNTDSGVEPRALELAKLFMDCHGEKARGCRSRSQLSKLYVQAVKDNDGCGFIPPEWDDVNEQRPFAQILFAIAHGMKLVRVMRGRELVWNRYRDNKGEKLPEDEVKRIREETGAQLRGTPALPSFIQAQDELAYLHNEMRRLHADRIRMEDRIAYLEREVGRGPPGRGSQGGRGDHRIGGTSRRQQYRQ